MDYRQQTTQTTLSTDNMDHQDWRQQMAWTVLDYR